MSASRPTVLQVLSVLAHGGSERVALDGAAAWVEAGGRSIMVGAPGPYEAEIARRGVEIRHLPLDGNAPWRILANIGRLEALMRAEAVDLVHWHNRAPGWAALAAARRLGCPTVSTYHSLYGTGFPGKVAWNAVMVRADRAIVTSAYAEAHVARVHGAVGGRRVLIANGVDTALFDPARIDPETIAAVRAQMGAGPDHVLAVLPARFTALKGHRETLAALALLPDAARAALRLAFVGADGSDHAAGIAALAARAGGVAVLPARDDMPAVLAAADVVLSPSTRRESFALVRVEAGAMERPLIATRLGAAEEIVVTAPGAETGVLVAPGDVPALAAALERLIAMPAAARAAMGARARAHVLAQFDLARGRAALVALYRSLVDGA